MRCCSSLRPVSFANPKMTVSQHTHTPRSSTRGLAVEISEADSCLASKSIPKSIKSQAQAVLLGYLLLAPISRRTAPGRRMFFCVARPATTSGLVHPFLVQSEGSWYPTCKTLLSPLFLYSEVIQRLQMHNSCINLPAEEIDLFVLVQLQIHSFILPEPIWGIQAEFSDIR